MRIVRRSVGPLALAGADLGVGALLYHEVWTLLGGLLFGLGLLVLFSPVHTALVRHGAPLWRRLSEPTGE